MIPFSCFQLLLSCMCFLVWGWKMDYIYALRISEYLYIFGFWIGSYEMIPGWVGT